MDGNDEHALGTLLRRWRERALLTQEQLAEKAGLNVRTIRRLERGDPHRPRTASLRLLSEALDLNTAEHTLLTATHTVQSPAAARERPPFGTPDFYSAPGACGPRPPTIPPCATPPHTTPPHTTPPHADPPHAGPPHAGPPHADPPPATLFLAALPLAVRDAAARLRSAWDAGHVRDGGHRRCPGPFNRSPGNAAP
ncbi:helix-turn-helix domain-containing protein [Nonomuraea bangladeshensis]|uniref:helix-turn-helix domain-containing protein n=1 Tax=Nonomuraea bangladeshensis TaxID=404385 RepID=UPI003C2AF0BE